jgi:hypothetical protein
MGKRYDYLTYEARRDIFVVHGWSTYPESSVLAGQAMKCYIDSFSCEEDVKAKYPEAEASHPMLQPQNTFDHLPDDGDEW